jgi:hypothetical protein
LAKMKRFAKEERMADSYEASYFMRQGT